MKLNLNQDFYDSLRQIGVDFDAVIKKADLGRLAWERTPDLTHQEYFSLLTVLNEMLSDEQLLNFSDIQRMKLFIPPPFAAMCAVDGYQGIKRLAKYKSLIGPVRLSLCESQTTLTVTFEFDYDKALVPRLLIVNEQLLLISLLRTATGRQIVPERIKCAYAYGYYLENYIGIKAETADVNEMTFSKKCLNTPFITSNNIMWEFLEPGFAQQLQQQQTNKSLKNTLQNTLLTAIPSGNFDIKSVSKTLGLSIRNLQRLLTEEGTTYSAEVQQTKVKLACGYLQKQELPTTEIGYLLGYNDVSSFRRAFKHWTGKTVFEYKQIFGVKT
ncbi:MAG: helix-turn-helix domain-containing protein [Lachnospiraceae bacterium]